MSSNVHRPVTTQKRHWRVRDDPTLAARWHFANAINLPNVEHALNWLVVISNFLVRHPNHFIQPPLGNPLEIAWCQSWGFRSRPGARSTLPTPATSESPDLGSYCCWLHLYLFIEKSMFGWPSRIPQETGVCLFYPFLCFFLCFSLCFFYMCIYIYIYIQPIFGGTLRLWGSNLSFLHRLVACLASQEWDQPMREYIETIRAGKGGGHQLIQVIWVSFDKLDFWDYKQVGVLSLIRLIRGSQLLRYWFICLAHFCSSLLLQTPSETVFGVGCLGPNTLEAGTTVGNVKP